MGRENDTPGVSGRSLPCREAVTPVRQIKMTTSRIRGTWESDHDKTLWELMQTLGKGHPKTIEYASNPSTLILDYGEEFVTYYFRDMVCQSFHRIIAEDEHTIMTEVEPCDLNKQELWHIHFLDSNTYWVTVDLDWGITYREFFRRLSTAEANGNLMNRAMRSWKQSADAH
jgi:hypothetical protein